MTPEISNIIVKVSHRAKSNLFYESNLEVKSLTTKERFLNGFKFLGLSILAGLCFVLIPVLHFVLVPLSLFFGIFMFYRQVSFRFFRLKKTIHCPECKKEIELKSAPFNWPILENCNNCRAQIIIQK
jgi:hypothetical protein